MKVEAQMDDLRRGVRLLEGLPGVDRSRLAFVGHDYGAMYGALLSSEDTPVSAFVLIAPSPTWVDWVVYSVRDPELLAALAGVEFLEDSSHHGVSTDGSASRLNWLFSRWGRPGPR